MLSVLLMINIRGKFEVSSLNCSRFMEGSQNSKSRSRDPFTTCKQGVVDNPVFEFLDFDLPIHFSTFIGLR